MTSFESVCLLQLELCAVVTFDCDKLVHFLLMIHQSLQYFHRLVEDHLLFLSTIFVHLDLGQSLLSVYTATRSALNTWLPTLIAVASVILREHACTE